MIDQNRPSVTAVWYGMVWVYACCGWQVPNAELVDPQRASPPERERRVEDFTWPRHVASILCCCVGVIGWLYFNFDSWWLRGTDPPSSRGRQTRKHEMKIHNMERGKCRTCDIWMTRIYTSLRHVKLIYVVRQSKSVRTLSSSSTGNNNLEHLTFGICYLYIYFVHPYQW